MGDRKLRFSYLSGPVDGLEVYNLWATGRNLGHFGTSYLSQFYQICSEFDAEGYVITTLPGSFSRHRAGQFIIENRPAPSALRGLLFHLANAIWVLRLLPNLWRFNPHIMIITAQINYWFLLTPLKRPKKTIIAAIHCTLWPKFRPVRRSWRLLLWLNSMFFANCVDAIMAVSNDVADQVRELIRQKHLTIKVFIPTYARGRFAAIRPANFQTHPFRILFAGRIETNKGVHDIVEIAQLLDDSKPQMFHFDICGEGSEFKAIAKKITSIGLTEAITLHGLCAPETLLALLQDSHAVIVPTTSDFEEGFNKVCAEAVLAGRPLVTSAVCPALAHVRQAAIEVPHDNVSAYCHALLDLASNRQLYDTKVAACKALQEQFYEMSNSWGAQLRSLLRRKLPDAHL